MDIPINNDKLYHIRQQISSIDYKIKSLIDQRMDWSEKAAFHKLQYNLNIHNERLEKQKLKLLASTDDKFYPQYKDIFKTIFHHSKIVQLSQILDKNLVLIGMSGVGKTTLGKKISKILNLPFIDTDMLIKKQLNKNPSQIIKEYGMEHFRNLENQIISDFLFTLKHPHLISGGGGLILHEDLMRQISSSSIVIHIQKSVNWIYNVRQDQDLAPYFGNKQNIVKIFKEREHLYKRYTQINITHKCCMDKCVEKILYKLFNRDDLQKHKQEG